MQELEMKLCFKLYDDLGDRIVLLSIVPLGHERSLSFAVPCLYIRSNSIHELTDWIRTLMGGNMRNLVICGLILFALSLNCGATAPVQLSGINGQAVLSQIAGPAQTNNTSANFGQTNNTSTNTNLWNWGGVPFGFTLNKSGILAPFDYENNGVWTPSI